MPIALALERPPRSPGRQRLGDPATHPVSLIPQHPLHLAAVAPWGRGGNSYSLPMKRLRPKPETLQIARWVDRDSNPDSESAIQPNSSGFEDPTPVKSVQFGEAKYASAGERSV